MNQLADSSIHVIAHALEDKIYVQEKDERGKSSIRKVGMAPEQQDDMPYEFDVVLDMNTVQWGDCIKKLRCSELAGKLITKPG